MWMVFWTFLTPPPPHVDHFRNKGYVLMWIFREPPFPPGHSHCLWMFPQKWLDLVLFEENHAISKHLKLHRLFPIRWAPRQDY